ATSSGLRHVVRYAVSVCSASVPPLDHHSSPTRRSSDLRRAIDRCVACAGIRGCRRNKRHAPRAQGSRLDLRESEGGGSARPDHRDRKSTRLNSSHVKISYAVFCLKKKNNDSAGELTEET